MCPCCPFSWGARRDRGCRTKLRTNEGMAAINPMQQTDDDELTQKLLERLPHVKTGSKILETMVKVHQVDVKITNTYKCSGEECTFCKYHVDEMLDDKFDVETEQKQVCKERNLVYLVYCIGCDHVRIGFTTEQFRDVSFERGYKRCGSERPHEEKRLRYMMIYQSNSDKTLPHWAKKLSIEECDIIRVTPDQMESFPSKEKTSSGPSSAMPPIEKYSSGSDKTGPTTTVKKSFKVKKSSTMARPSTAFSPYTKKPSQNSKDLKVPPEGKKSPQPGMATRKEVLEHKKKLSKQLKDLKGNPAPDVLTKRLPYIREKPTIRRVIVHLHKIFETYSQKTAPLCIESRGSCTFCRYHVEIMEDHFTDEHSTNRVCQETNVVYLMYCIHCDEAFLGFTEERFERLLNIRFGFLDDKVCVPEKGHSKRYLRCIVIDKKDSQFSKNIYLKKGETQLSTWEQFLKVKIFTNKNEQNYDVPNDGLYLSQQYHRINDSEVKIYFPSNLPLLDSDSENIVYLIVCNNCRIRYVGRTSGTFFMRYPSSYSQIKQQNPFHPHTVAEGSECTFRDYRWSVIDALSNEQQQFLNSWTELYNQCDPKVKTKIWAVIANVYGSFKDPLIQTVMKSNNLNIIKNRVMEFKIDNETVNSAMQKMNTEKLSKEAFLKRQNEQWIQNTKKAFIEDREDYWMKKLQAVENGLNRINAARSGNISANLYNEDFKNLGNK
ncbi:unnamed protein product [Lymnaea stagnalis]|uniref:Uncharacterized protein n=1 Tax=Lymnaea stagnalis TaxID=6523 RepID=A0AAV2HNZ9_LYMST